MVRRFTTSPPLYGIAAGLLVSAFGLHVPVVIADPLAVFAGATGSCWRSVSGSASNSREGAGKAALVFAGRLVSALAVAVALVLILGLTGPDRTVMLLLGVAPTPFFIVAFATMENLDVRLTVNVLSLSMLTSLPLALLVILLTS